MFHIQQSNMDGKMIRFCQSTIWTFVIAICLSEAVRLNDHILHYEGLDYDTAHIKLQHRRVARSTNSQHRVEIKFNAHGRDFHLRLKRDVITFSKEFRVVTSQGEIPMSFEDAPMYIGELVDESGTYCHGSVKDGQFEGRILIPQLSEYYSVEPSSRYLKDADFHSIIYKDEDVVLPDELEMKDDAQGSCGVKGEIKKRMDEKLKNLRHSEDDSEASYRKKRQTINEDEQTCSLFIQADHTFYERHGSFSEVVSQIGQHVQSASYIYENTDFGDYRNISFSVERLRVWTPDDIGSVTYLFGNNYIGVEKFLDLASTGNFNDYCLAYTFANRDFANGVLGLAWIASSSRRSNGGICDKQTSNGQTLNTGIVTTNNYEANVPPLVSHLTFAHEIGHSFGSQHDPVSDSCTPGGDFGNYIMFSHSSAGNLINNQQFSPCSITAISNVLSTVFLGYSKTNCFKSKADITFCGNGITEEDEECDCGYEEECTTSCCIPQNADNSNPNACRLAPSAVCSPTEGTCCDESTCAYKPNTEQCEASDECHGPAFCSGNSAVCPDTTPEADLTQCDGGRKLCKEGECSESICFLQSRRECQCTDQVELCDLCCMDERTGLCLSSYRLGLPPGQQEPLRTDTGSPCNDYMGYCDGFSECRQVDEDGPLASIIRKIFYSDQPQLTDAIREWLTTYWYAVLIIGIAVILLMVLIVFLCNRVIPTDNPWDQEVERFKKRSSVYVKLQRKRYRGSMAPGMHPPPIESHPDHVVEHRATPF